MASSSYRILPLSDDEVFRRFKRVWDDLGQPTPASWVGVLFGSRNVSGPLSKAENDPSLAAVLETRQAVFSNFRVSLPDWFGVDVQVQRTDEASILHASIQDQAPVESQVRFAGAVRKHFGSAMPSANVAKAIGKEVSELIESHAAVVGRLDETTQRVLEQIVRHRETLDAQLIEQRRSLQQEFDERAARLRQEVAERDAELKAREQALADERAMINDRSNTHVRRELREELKQQLKERSDKFALSPTTNAKRLPVLIGFGMLIATLAGVFVAELFERSTATVAYTQTEAIAWAVRLALTSVGLAAAIVYFIRWNDQWLQRHAAEEFRQARMSLDVDRASWIVEMALEWKEEKGTQIPPELVERLSRSLFLDEGKRDVARHPVHDASSALIRAASGAKVNVPGFGEFTFDRKGLDRLERQAEEGE